MNWVTTKMPDAHWLTEARLKGTKVVVIACEYSSTSPKGDEVIVVRPGTTPALALGLAASSCAKTLRCDYVGAGLICRSWCGPIPEICCGPRKSSAVDPTL